VAVKVETADRQNIKAIDQGNGTAIVCGMYERREDRSN
jgi:hypothetical protein